MMTHNWPHKSSEKNSTDSHPPKRCGKFYTPKSTTCKMSCSPQRVRALLALLHFALPLFSTPSTAVGILGFDVDADNNPVTSANVIVPGPLPRGLSPHCILPMYPGC